MHDAGCQFPNSINFYNKQVENKLNLTLFLILEKTNHKLEMTRKKQMKAMRQNMSPFQIYICTPDCKKMKLILNFQAIEGP